MPKFKSIRMRLLAASVSIVLLPMLASTIISSIVGIHTGYQQVVSELRMISDLKESEIDRWIYNRQRDLDLLLTADEELSRLRALLSEPRSSPAFQAVQERLQKDFRNHLNKAWQIKELFVMNRQGHVLASINPGRDGEYRVLLHGFEERGKTAESRIQIFAPSGGTSAVMIVHPLLDRKGRFLGILAGKVELKTLDRIMREQAGGSKTIETYLVASNHVLLTGSRFPGYSAGKTHLKTQGVDAAVDEHRSGVDRYSDYRNEPVIGVYRWLPDLSVALLAEQDQSEAFRLMGEVLKINLMVAGIATLLAILASLGLTRSLTRPLSDLAEKSRAIAAGNLEVNIAVEREDEIGLLAIAFKQMLANLRQMKGDLEKRVLERTAQLEAANEDKLRLQQQQIESLKEADRLKDEFLSILSHELRTPLNAIMGFGSILNDGIPGSLNPQQQEFVAKIVTASEHMLELICDLLDFANLKAGKFKVSPAFVSYPPLVAEVVAALSPAIQKKRLEVSVDLRVPETVFIDGSRISQVLSKILSNAIKFTPEGGRITLRAFVENGNLLSEVQDSGIGIAADELPKLFTPFKQLDMSYTRKFGGTGLGLSICKGIVELHGGSIEATSPGLGKGSIFRFILPLVKGPASSKVW